MRSPRPRRRPVSASASTRAPGAVVPVTVDGRRCRSSCRRRRRGDRHRQRSRHPVGDVAVRDDRRASRGCARRRGRAPAAPTGLRPRQRAGRAAGWPLVKPIDAVVGSVPNGDAARSGSSHACSGSRPCPEVMFAIAVEQRGRADAVAGGDVVLAALAASTGHRWPEPRVGRRPRRAVDEQLSARLEAVAVAVLGPRPRSCRIGRTRARCWSGARSRCR